MPRPSPKKSRLLKQYLVTYTVIETTLMQIRRHCEYPRYKLHFMRFTNDLARIIPELQGGRVQDYEKDRGVLRLRGGRVIRDIKVQEVPEEDAKILSRYFWPPPPDEDAPNQSRSAA